MPTKTVAKKTPAKKPAAKKPVAPAVEVNPFDEPIAEEKAKSYARQTWSYNYNVIVATLIGVNILEEGSTKIPDELIPDIKQQILNQARERVTNEVEKKTRGDVF